MEFEWTPRTQLGKDVLDGKITNINQIIKKGWKIKEPEIVDKLLPDLGKDIIFIGGSPGKGGGIRRTSTRRTARMHRSGRRFNINACVVVGRPGYIGIGKASGSEHSVAIEKATQQAKLNIIPLRRGCGSWECACVENHSIPLKISGKSGAVTVELLPAPKGIGLCIGDEMKKILRLSGIDDIWSKVFGDTRTRFSYALALFDALKNLNKVKMDEAEEESLDYIAPGVEEVLEEKEEKTAVEVAQELVEKAKNKK